MNFTNFQGQFFTEHFQAQVAASRTLLSAKLLLRVYVLKQTMKIFVL